MVDLAVMNADQRRLGTVIGLLPGSDLDPILQQAVGSQIRLSFFVRIPGPPQLRGNVPRPDRFPGADRPRQGVNFRRIRKYRSAEALLNDPVVLDIEVREQDGERNCQNQERYQRCPQHRIARQSADSLGFLAISLRDSDLDRHGSDTYSIIEIEPSGRLLTLSDVRIREKVCISLDRRPEHRAGLRQRLTSPRGLKGFLIVPRAAATNREPQYMRVSQPLTIPN